MARTRPYRPACFDRAGRLLDDRLEFVVTPPAGRVALAVGGSMLLAGQRFDKALVDVRRLRQMYEGRLIALAPGQTPLAPVLSKPRAIGPAEDSSVPAPGAEQSPRGVIRRRLARAAA